MDYILHARNARQRGLKKQPHLGGQVQKVPGVLSLPAPGLLLVGPLAPKQSLGQAKLLIITATSVTDAYYSIAL